MTQWMEMVFRGSLTLLQNVLRDAAAAATSDDVATAKRQVKSEIQRHRRLPGTLRRWLCQEVDAIAASDAETFRKRLSEEIDRLSH
ncbi:MAG TPA: hypothetical protein VGM51_04140 [Armatimonadota bacterium]|jgi:hypothetical protein